MYSHLPNAVAELIANSYDADASTVKVVLGSDASISVIDDGHGMSRDEVADKYLHIGRNRRLTEGTFLTESGHRRVSGKKGLGKLALFGIGKKIRLSTSRRGSEIQTVIEMSYDAMMDTKGDYQPAESSTDVPEESHGTQVVLAELKRTSAVDPFELAASLSKLFNYADTEFRVAVVSASGEAIEVDAQLRLSTTDDEFLWPIPEALSKQDSFLAEQNVSGLILSTKKPLRHGQRGVTLYANGRLVNEPEFFGSSESSYAYSYLTGYLNVDFIDTLGQDVIATDRRALDWDTDVTSSLREALEKLLTRIGQEWRVRRSEARRQTHEESLGVSTEAWIESIKSTERTHVGALIESISSDDLDITPDQQASLLEKVKEVAPPNAEYVWRHLHPEIKTSAESYYLADDYYQAVQEAIKRYITIAKKKAALNEDEAMKVVTGAFGSQSKLRVFDRFATTGKFGELTVKNIEDGQKHLSMGIVTGFRNPLAHEEIKSLHDEGAFTYQDCLDALSILSHLMKRLSESSVAQTPPV